MSSNQCERRCSCSAAAIIVSIIVGAVTAILQGTGVIEVSTVFLYGALITALVYLGVLLIASAASCECARCYLQGVLALVGILGTVVFSGILLGVTSGAGVLGAVLVGVLLFFVTLTLSSVACLVLCNIRD